MSKKLVISFLVGSAFSALALWLALRNVPLDELLAYMTAIDPGWTAFTLVLVLLSFSLRVVRWKLILHPAARVPFWDAFHPLMIGFMLNCILPGRVGELARPALLSRNRKIPMTTGLATVAAERLMDITMLMLLFVLVISRVSISPSLDMVFGKHHLNREILEGVALAMAQAAGIFILAVGLIGYDRTRGWVQSVVAKAAAFLETRPGAAARFFYRACNLLLKIIDNVAAGLALGKDPVRLAACAGLTVGVWITAAFSYYTMAKGCPGIDLTPAQMTAVMVIICFVIALPSVPGFWGLWEAGGVFALAVFGVEPTDAAGYTLVNHAVQMLPVIAVGLISAMITSVNIWQLADSRRQMPG